LIQCAATRVKRPRVEEVLTNHDFCPQIVTFSFLLTKRQDP